MWTLIIASIVIVTAPFALLVLVPFLYVFLLHVIFALLRLEPVIVLKESQGPYFRLEPSFLKPFHEALKISPSATSNVFTSTNQSQGLRSVVTHLLHNRRTRHDNIRRPRRENRQDDAPQNVPDLLHPHLPHFPQHLIIPPILQTPHHLPDKTPLRRARHRRLLVRKAHHNRTDSAFQRRRIESRLAGHEILDDHSAGRERLVCVRRPVHVELDQARVDAAREAGAVREARAAHRGPQRAFDGVEVGDGDHEGGDLRVRVRVRAAGGGEREGGVDGRHWDDVGEFSWVFAGGAEAREARVHGLERLPDVEVGDEGLPGGDGVGEFFEVGDDEHAEVGKAAEGVSDLFELGDDGLRGGLEEAPDAFEVQGFDEGAAGSAD